MSNYCLFCGIGNKHNIMTENMAKILMAIEMGVRVKNEKGEQLAPSDHEQRTDDCIKCYVKCKHKRMYYLSSASKQQLFVENIPFDQWLETIPLESLA